MRHMFNVVRTIDFGLYAVKPPATRIDLDSVRSSIGTPPARTRIP